MATCLVTGGAGFIGSHLVESLVARGHPVRVLDDFSTGQRENLRELQDRVAIVHGSVTDPDAVAAAVRGSEWVFHLAALPSVQRSIEDPVATHEVCAKGTLLVLEAARRAGVQRLVYAASSSAYGDCPGLLRSEQDPVSPLSPYAAAKLAGEYYCRSFTTVYGLATVRLRFFNVFGPRQVGSSPYSGVIARFIATLSAALPPLIYGDGLQTRDFTYVANAVQALLLAAEAPAAIGNVYNIGNGCTTSVLALVQQINELRGSQIQLAHGPPRAGDVRQSQADITRARHDLGYEPNVSLQEGLRRTLEAHQAARQARLARLDCSPGDPVPERGEHGEGLGSLLPNARLRTGSFQSP